MENWKAVAGFEGRYEVSDLGRVRSLGFKRIVRGNVGFMKGRILRSVLDNHGYYQVHLSGDDRKVHKRMIHRLVAGAFLEPMEGKTNVNHKDGVKTNNAATNLEWCTLEENSQHAVKVLRETKGQFEAVPVIIEKDGHSQPYNSIADAARAIKVRKMTLVMALRRGNKCQGFSITKQPSVTPA